MRNVTMARSVLFVVAVVLLLSALPMAASAQGNGPYQFYSLTPCRVADTRKPVSNPAPPTGGPILAEGTTRNFPIQGLCGVPAGAKAVALNVTVVGPNGNGYLKLYPVGIAQPPVSTINFNAGEPALANGALVPLGPSDGSGCPSACPADLAVYAKVAVAGGTVHMVVDVTGFFQ